MNEWLDSLVSFARLLAQAANQATGAGSDPPQNFWYWIVGLFISAIGTMWAALWYFVKTREADAKAEREAVAHREKLEREAYERREQQMAQVVSSNSQFIKEALMSTIKNNTEAMNATSFALQQNTEATKQQIRVTEELRLEIRELRKESRTTREARESREKKTAGGEDDESGIHNRSR